MTEALWAIVEEFSFLVALVVLMAICRSMNPLRVLAITSLRLIAAGYLLREMWMGAWLRRDRWSECVERANSECWIQEVGHGDAR